VQRLLGEVDRPRPEVLVGVEADLLEDMGAARDLDLALRPAHPGRGLAGERLEDLDLNGEVGVGVVVDLNRSHVGLLLVPVQPFDVVLRAVLEVDRLVVQEDRRRELISLSDHLGPRPGDVDDHDVVGVEPAQRDALGRECLARPVPAASGAAAHAVLLEQLQEVGDVRFTERFPGLEGQLEKPGLEMAGEHQQVVGVDEARLGAGAKEVAGMPHDELVQR
jgi:hypothetical protein